MIYNNGNIFNGEWIDDKEYKGNGFIYYDNKDSYEGKIKEGKKMEKEYIIIIMEINMKENLKIIKKKGKE